MPQSRSTGFPRLQGPFRKRNKSVIRGYNLYLYVLCITTICWYNLVPKQIKILPCRHESKGHTKYNVSDLILEADRRVRENSRECHLYKLQPFPRERGNRQNQTSANRTNVRKALRLRDHRLRTVSKINHREV